MTAKMMAVGYAASLPITDERSLFEFETPVPRPGDRDLLVRVQAVSVNPVDVKVRMRKQGTEAEPVILGWDAAGIVEAVGASCRLFKPGDHVYYAGNVNRPGTDAPFHLVDERIVGRKPKSLSFAEAAALPLTTLTAWELMFDRIGVKRGEGRGPPLAPGRRRRGRRRLDRHPARAQAHRPHRHRHRLASRRRRPGCRDLGAHHVIDHSKPFAPQLKAAGFPTADIVLALTGTTRNASQITEVISPQGRLGLIEGMDSLKAFDTAQLWSKCVSIHPELMFTRSTFGTARHDRAASPAQRNRRARRSRCVAHDDDHQLRAPERRRPQARARPARERHDHRQDRAGGEVGVRPSGSDTVASRPVAQWCQTRRV